MATLEDSKNFKTVIDLHRSEVVRNNVETTAISIALHLDVPYGGGGSMLDQVLNTAAIVHLGTVNTPECKTITTAALLHKSWEEKRISKDSLPLTDEYILHAADADVLHIVREIGSEPEEDKSQSKTDQWKAKTKWAEELSPETQTILLAEKVQNYLTSCLDPNPNKPLAWHKEYYETRDIMVQALQGANKTLYDMACAIKEAGLANIEAAIAAGAESFADLKKDDQTPPPPKP